ncbi:nucleophile aminohydrolase [Radiomyces spectabilis]|uniref:nucleophile aminohydrolase n=1 Tax=Radiomyces spectabilis TaxID=64574 RepID=UPI00221F65FE|nr:nucleophile aminohydrolase [Radiomyces spectabilis]KAI8391052.1 nucleophile aminohydrolase [Radiomyces spectabilis]
MAYAFAEPRETVSHPIEHRFEPYDDNGGTSVAIAGKDFCLVASDTRQSTGYSINSRFSPKCYKLSNTAAIAMNGFHADGLTLKKVLDQRLKWYKFSHDKDMSCTALAQMLSITLYQRRFFPYYAFCILGGVDENGEGAVYCYDAIGSFERETCRASGSASALIQPFLDNQVSRKNIQEAEHPTLDLDTAIRIVKDAFTSATERDIYTGDSLQIFIIRKDRDVELQTYPLKRD